MSEAPDFIEVFDNVLDASVCRDLIARFEADANKQRGATGSGVETSLKDSWDITISRYPGWNNAEGVLNNAMLRGLRAYLRKHPYTLLGPLYLRMKDPRGGDTSVLNAESIGAMDDAYLTALIMKVYRPGTINLQKYIADVGGYPHWHCEVYPVTDNPDVLNRTLLWTIYLNDGFRAGETEFLHQRRKIAPKAGSLLIAPSAWTHTHRGNRPLGGDKYIATSWVLFQRAEAVYT